MRVSLYNEEYADFFGQAIIAGGVIVYTIIFAVKYLKRMISIIFLTLLAPISCITYPIDKIKDGKSQAFNFWLREFLLEVIIQPFHLLIFVVLIGSASALATTNPLYSLLCFAIMLPAEKVVKQMFGIQPNLLSPLSAAAGGAIMNQVMNAARNIGKGGSSGGNESNKVKSDDDNSNELPNTKPDINSYNNGSDTDEDSRTSGVGENNSYGSRGGDPYGPGREDSYGSRGRDPYGSDRENSYSLVEGTPYNLGGEDSYNSGEENPYDSDGENLYNLNEPLEDEGYDNIPLDDGYDTMQDEEEGPSELEMAAMAEDEEAGEDEEAEQFDEQKPKSKIRKAWDSLKGGTKDFIHATALEHNNKLIEKYGTQNKAKVALKRAGKLAGGVGKKVFKLAAGTLAGAPAAIASGTLGFLASGGDLKAAAGLAAAGFGIGRRFGVRGSDAITKRVKAMGTTIKPGLNAIRTPKRLLKIDKQKYYANSDARKNAIKYYRENHDGKMPSTRDVNKLLDQRYKYKRMGLEEDDINKAVKVEDSEKKKIDEQAANNKLVAQNYRDDAEYRADVNSLYDPENSDMNAQAFNDKYGEGAANDAIRFKQFQDLQDIHEKMESEELANNGRTYAQNYNLLMSDKGDKAKKAEEFDNLYGEGAARKAQMYNRNMHPLIDYDSYTDSIANTKKANLTEQVGYAAKVNDSRGYSGRDFLDAKKMQGEVDNFTASYKASNPNASDAEARMAATEQIRLSAALKGVDNPNIPGMNNAQQGNSRSTQGNRRNAPTGGGNTPGSGGNTSRRRWKYTKATN